MLKITGHIDFPQFSAIRCLMMPYIQGQPDSLPELYAPYRDIVSSLFYEKGDIGFLTIDESPVVAGNPHRGARAKFGRALHTEVGRDPEKLYCWGDGGHWGSLPTRQPTKKTPEELDREKATPKVPYHWGGGAAHKVTLDRNVQILIASNLDNTCAVWDKEHEDTSEDGDIGDQANLYPYEDAVLLKAGQVASIGILTPHESLPVQSSCNRQFLRIVSSGVHGREPYFTRNPLVTFN